MGWGLYPCSIPIFHVASSARASCLLCFHDAQAAAGPTSVALFYMLGGKRVVGPGVQEKVYLISSVDALFLQGCWAPPAASCFWGHAVTTPHSRLKAFLQELPFSFVPTGNHLAACLWRTDAP